MESQTINSSQQNTKVELLGSHSFRMLKVSLAPGRKLIAETGTMASSQAHVKFDVIWNGDSFFNALLLRYLGQESWLVNVYENNETQPQEFYLTQSTPGEILMQEINNEVFFVQPGALIARSSQVKVKAVWAGFSSFLAGEGLFRLEISGQGKIWYGCYGAVIEKEVNGEYIVDSGHLLSYPTQMKLSLKTAGGLLTSILNKEGFVLKISGHGKIRLQSRSLKGLAAWLNPRFWS